jgi:hypothetical protein
MITSIHSKPLKMQKVPVLVKKVDVPLGARVDSG